ncbi:MAG: hypothetical protein ABJF11_04615 [Reichenbachiella sp.]|uniref:hypothetical protein n=1 Tax=Reichenbachiella sp. TaxID=2184521 RepID=UPI003265021B
MKRLLKNYGLVAVMLLLSGIWQKADAQTIQITNIEFDQNQVHLTYNLEDSIVGRYYTIRLYSSEDNFLNPLEKVSKEVGMEIKPGYGKELIWDAGKEFGSSFNGKVALEIRGRVFIPFINMEGFEDIQILKRRRDYNIIWTGGRPQNILNFNLYKGDKKVQTFPNIANVGHYKLHLPAHTKPGKDYRFVIADTKNTDEVVRTSQFRVKRKVPLVLKFVPVAILGGAVAYFLGKSPSSNSTSEFSIPDPISPN